MDRVVARLKAFTLEHWLTVLAGGLAVLLLVEGARYGCASRLTGGMGGELGSGDVSTVKRTGAREAGTRDLKDYDPIAKLGHLGSGPRAVQLAGILGDSALFGTSPESASPYAVGSTIPGGDKVVAIGINEVVVEKDGKQRTLKVFPELKMSLPKKPLGPPGPPAGPGSAPSPQPGEPPAAPQRPEGPTAEGSPEEQGSAGALEKAEEKEAVP